MSEIYEFPVQNANVVLPEDVREIRECLRMAVLYFDKHPYQSAAFIGQAIEKLDGLKR